MAAVQSQLQFSHCFTLYSPTHFTISKKVTEFSNRKAPRTRASVNGAPPTPTAPKPARRGRKKSPETKSTAKRRPRKSQPQNGTTEPNALAETEDFDDGIDFPYEDPPLICCFGAATKEFVPTVRVSEEQMHPDIYSQWKMLQWKPPEFARAPGGPPSNVAVAHARLGGRAAFLGKVGNDEFGEELVYLMNKEKVQTRGVKFDESKKTGCAFMKIKFEEGKMKAEVAKESAENSLLGSELNLAVLKETRIFHFNSEVLTSPCMQSTLFKAISWSKKFGGLIFFDLNLPLPLWKSRDETKEVIKKAWAEADVIEVSKQELEFLLDEEYYERRRNYRPQYYAENYEQTKNRRDYYHYTREELSPLWHDGLKFLFVTDGTLRIHYYTPSFDGVVVGTEDVLITPFTCDRTGSGDAVVAGIMRKLTTQPDMFKNQDVLERQLRFAIAAGIISQWTIGAVRSFPTESATQNLKEQVYVPSMW
ncbi:fructokinase-like 1, chloroplastic [Diospyros lotus]|uniref:fructokinase-like 1, chloroplastic n=1 Tax=Diospyros lotus TaxID=55363 RepID=UPI002257EF97|nr:fructokinase-like 1, chloroplastic [Diospyros lotus]XP_052176399.1 fructokinase-like 1, chloroplastic [Diospyros lotus]